MTPTAPLDLDALEALEQRLIETERIGAHSVMASLYGVSTLIATSRQLATLTARNTALTALLGEAVDGLEPFARAADYAINQHISDDDQIKMLSWARLERVCLCPRLSLRPHPRHQTQREYTTMTPIIYDKIEIGDKVLLDFEVKNKMSLLFLLISPYYSGWFDRTAVVQHIPKPKFPPKIGDHGFLKDGNRVEIRGINENEFWLKVDGRDGYITLNKSSVFF